jgi:hypothetical protein
VTPDTGNVETTWLTKPGLGRAHAVKPTGRTYCGQHGIDSAWVPDPASTHCGNCERLVDAAVAREAARKMEEAPPGW